MKQAQLTSHARIETGKGVARQLRMKGLIPAVLYGGENGNVPLVINSHDFRQILAKFGESSLIALDIKKNGETHNANVIIKDLQLDPVTRVLLHADFQEVTMGQIIEVTVHLRLAGESPGVKAGGLIEFLHRDVTVECLPSELIDHIDVDISALGIGDTLTIADISAGEGRTITDDPDTTIVTVTPPIAEEVEEVDEEFTEPEVIAKGKKPEEDQ